MHNSTDLDWTGERFLPGLGGNLALEHYHRYAFSRALARSKRVLDIACGEGYGSDMLAEVASNVTGIDIAAETIAHARATYRRMNLNFLQGACTSINLPDASIDLAVSFETLEHHAEHDLMLSELRRVLATNGMLIMSTPDKAHYSNDPNYHNEFHVLELRAEEFIALISRHFPYAVFLGQKIVYGSLMVPLNDGRDFLSFSMADDGPRENLKPIAFPYLLAIASPSPLPDLPASILDGTMTHTHELNMLRQEHRVANDLLAAIHGSTYWRLAAPVRWIRKKLRYIQGKSDA
ncbi:MAG: hypothetical protein A3F73_03760 [Gallionellales bacterium RIFCSPLOWO2_12_FULL_59_22]|nr:MAG: hypothetical protein A3H99_01080 [Gallionellales bacterium RIFCSPLOWO2_02_FULL_59_110]OGT01422.1 MAG: hypothetical protein A2Z65_13710 [Gallionellales bacterium RIFCSPLOWO2_02_58_13]OGT14499.1 MAG: hypothetical protein A3F73_03760 [Gallionellales bacterium RIFCSPLOWO2_12_FULL_59_22]